MRFLPESRNPNREIRIQAVIVAESRRSFPELRASYLGDVLMEFRGLRRCKENALFRIPFNFCLKGFWPCEALAGRESISSYLETGWFESTGTGPQI